MKHFNSRRVFTSYESVMAGINKIIILVLLLKQKLTLCWCILCLASYYVVVLNLYSISIHIVFDNFHQVLYYYLIGMGTHKYRREILVGAWKYEIFY